MNKEEKQFNVCINCDFRHGGCIQTAECYNSVYENRCNAFVPGKCFFCAMYQIGDESLCMAILYPDGCANFKPGDGYEEYLEYYNSQSLVQEITQNKNRKSKKADRRKRTENYKEKQKRTAAARKGWILSGPYFSYKHGRVMDANRSKLSSFFKKVSNRISRNLPLTDKDGESIKMKKGSYRRLFDFWWNLW